MFCTIMNEFCRNLHKNVMNGRKYVMNAEQDLLGEGRGGVGFAVLYD